MNNVGNGEPIRNQFVVRASKKQNHKLIQLIKFVVNLIIKLIIKFIVNINMSI